jgi:hypothetical protein
VRRGGVRWGWGCGEGGGRDCAPGASAHCCCCCSPAAAANGRLATVHWTLIGPSLSCKRAQACLATLSHAGTLTRARPELQGDLSSVNVPGSFLLWTSREIHRGSTVLTRQNFWGRSPRQTLSDFPKAAKTCRAGERLCNSQNLSRITAAQSARRASGVATVGAPTMLQQATDTAARRCHLSISHKAKLPYPRQQPLPAANSSSWDAGCRRVQQACAAGAASCSRGARRTPAPARRGELTNSGRLAYNMPLRHVTLRPPIS